MLFVDLLQLQAAKVRYEERLKMSIKMHSCLDGIKLNREWAPSRHGRGSQVGSPAATKQCVVK